MFILRNNRAKLLCIVILLSGLIATMIVTVFLLRMESLAASITEILLKEKLKGDLNSIHQYISEHYGSIYTVADSLFDMSGNPIGGDNILIDRLKSELNVDVTIFIRHGLDFERTSTTVLGDYGERAIGTTLGVNSEAYPYVVAGRSYIGKAMVLDIEYLTGYQPIFSFGNEIVGLMVVGIALKDAEKYTADVFSSAKMWIVWYIVIGFLLLDFCIYWVIIRGKPTK